MPMTNLSVKLSAEEAVKFGAYAAASGKTVSESLRELIGMALGMGGRRFELWDPEVNEPYGVVFFTCDIESD